MRRAFPFADGSSHPGPNLSFDTSVELPKMGNPQFSLDTSFRRASREWLYYRFLVVRKQFENIAVQNVLNRYGSNAEIAYSRHRSFRIRNNRERIPKRDHEIEFEQSNVRGKSRSRLYPRKECSCRCRTLPTVPRGFPMLPIPSSYQFSVDLKTPSKSSLKEVSPCRP
jgi:hypothetical protein